MLVDVQETKLKSFAKFSQNGGYDEKRYLIKIFE